jgi:hypothetical protein
VGVSSPSHNIIWGYKQIHLYHRVHSFCISLFSPTEFFKDYHLSSRDYVTFYPASLVLLYLSVECRIRPVLGTLLDIRARNF